MSKLLSKQELRDKIVSSLYFEEQWRYDAATDEIMELIESQKNAAVDEAYEEWHGNTGL